MLYCIILLEELSPATFGWFLGVFGKRNLGTADFLSSIAGEFAFVVPTIWFKSISVTSLSYYIAGHVGFFNIRVP